MVWNSKGEKRLSALDVFQRWGLSYLLGDSIWEIKRKKQR